MEVRVPLCMGQGLMNRILLHSFMHEKRSVLGAPLLNNVHAVPIM